MKLASSLFAVLCLCTPSAFAEGAKTTSETSSEIAADGSYKGSSTRTATDAAGTTLKSKVQESEMKDSKGETRVVSKSETVQDPKGLMNKSWSEHETELRRDAAGNYEKDIAARSVDAAGTSHTVDEEIKRKVAANGASTTIVNKTITTDPKGLMNKHTTEVEEVTKRHADGTVTKSVKNEVDGQVAEHTTR